MRHTKILLAVALGVAIAAACGSDEGESSGSTGHGSGGAAGDAGPDGLGATGGGDPTCTNPVCTGCQGCFLICMCEKNNADQCLMECSGGGGMAGTAGVGGAGGTSGGGAGGTSGGGTGGSGGGGSCNPSFCPNPGFGSPCCVTPNGPCGADMGMGCMPTTGGDN